MCLLWVYHSYKKTASGLLENTRIGYDIVKGRLGLDLTGTIVVRNVYVSHFRGSIPEDRIQRVMDNQGTVIQLCDGLVRGMTSS